MPMDRLFSSPTVSGSATAKKAGIDMDSQDLFYDVMCARCACRAGRVRAYTIAGAIRKSTVDCKGVVHKQGRPVATRCFVGDRSRMEQE